MPVWTIAIDIIQDVRGSIAMYMFIIEEAIQTIGMACYLLYKHKKYSDLKEVAKWALDNLVNPAIDFAETYGHVAYPLEMAYKAFYQASKKNFENYLRLTEK